MLLKPGATPQSTTAVTPWALANASSSNGSSPKNEISTTFFSASMIACRVAKPMNPGTAPITRSALRTTLLHDLRAGQIGHLTGERVLGRQRLDALPAGVHARDTIFTAQVGGDRAAHHARAQNDDVFHWLSSAMGMRFDQATRGGIRKAR